MSLRSYALFPTNHEFKYLCVVPQGGERAGSYPEKNTEKIFLQRDQSELITCLELVKCYVNIHLSLIWLRNEIIYPVWVPVENFRNSARAFYFQNNITNELTPLLLADLTDPARPSRAASRLISLVEFESGNCTAEQKLWTHYNIQNVYI